MNSESIGESAAALDAPSGVAPETMKVHSRPLPRIEADSPPPVIRAREEHNISRRDIDPDALRALYRLSRNNYIAYLVGGSVRDLLLSRKPKDFDISTDARPEQIRALFRNCILIGRRFRLAHIRYGDKVIETSTFRRTPESSGDPADPQADLFQRDDNLFGTPREDALRRDFTVNGLFYDIDSFSIIDYVGGLEDLARRRIRSIGDPCIRFREDPVRMIRAIRFASRLEFDLDPDTRDAIQRHCGELSKASPARLLEEITRLFAFSAGERAVRLLRATGLLDVLLPEVDKCLDDERLSHDLFWKRLEALDRGDTVLPDATPALLFAVLLLDPLKRHLGREWTAEDFPRLKFEKIHSFLEPLALRLRFPRKLVDRIVHMYLSQNRFTSPGGKAGAIANFVTQDSFHESLALAEISLAAEGGCPARLNQWRDMLLERMYSREEGAGQERRSGGEGRREEETHGQSSQSAPGGQSQNAPGGEERGRLSRSARRRRNKKMRRQHDRAEPARREGTPTDGENSPEKTAETATSPAEAAPRPLLSQPTLPRPIQIPPPLPPAAPTVEAGHVPPPAVAADGREERKKADGSRRRRSRGRKRDGRAETSPASASAPAPQPSATPEEPFHPLTAAAFYRPPAPPVEETAKEKEPESTDRTEKKRAGRKSGTRGGKKDKSGAAPKDHAGTGESSRFEAPRPLREDKADEADRPMHWLDEI